MTNANALALRAKKLGVLIRSARKSARREVDECAQAIGVSPEAFSQFEQGESSPSLPELEALSYFLDLPVEVFWDDKLVSEGQYEKDDIFLTRFQAVRQRMIGAQLRMSRLERGFSLVEVAEKAFTSPTLLEAYEMGQKPIPFPDLEALSAVLDLPMKALVDVHGPVGAQSTRRRAVENFLALPPELQEFVGKPINQPYLELAQRLSKMDAAQLRTVAEGLLEITL